MRWIGKRGGGKGRKEGGDPLWIPPPREMPGEEESVIWDAECGGASPKKRGGGKGRNMVFLGGEVREYPMQRLWACALLFSPLQYVLPPSHVHDNAEICLPSYPELVRCPTRIWVGPQKLGHDR